MNFTKKRIGWHYPATLTRIRRGLYELQMRTINDTFLGPERPYLLLGVATQFYARLARPISGHKRTWDVDIWANDGQYIDGQVVSGSLIDCAEWALFRLRDLHGVPESPYEWGPNDG